MGRLIIIAVLFLVSISGVFAQNYSQVFEDFGVWNNVTLDYDWTKKWSSSLDVSLRLDENASELKSLFSEFSLERDLKKKWDVGAVLRYTQRTSSESVRFSAYVKKYYRFKPINLKYRLKVDVNYGLFSSDQFPFDEVIRNKFSLEYKRKKHRLGGYFSTELFHEVDRDLALPSAIRFKVGSSYKINKMFDVDLSYIIQEELHKAKPVRDYIVSWGISMDL